MPNGASATSITRVRVLNFDLRFRRGDFHLHAAATIEAGATGICGPSGCGKSTLLALIAGLLRPDAGTLVFRGETLVETSHRAFVPAWFRHFALVFPGRTVVSAPFRAKDNLLYGYRRRSPEERRIDLKQVLDLLEIGPLVDRRPAQLSGGERQRVALGRALLYSPRMLLLDEPLASLDERLKQQILPFLKRVKDETGLPMLYVSHAHSEVEFLADRTLRMEDGRLVA